VRESCRFITNSSGQVDKSLVDDVWHRHIPAKVSLFVWRLLRNRLPTRDNLLRQHILHSNDFVCAVGCGVLETTRRLFLECGTSNILWPRVWNWVGFSPVPPCELRDHQFQFSYMAGMPRCTHSFLKGIWFACVCVIWKDPLKAKLLRPILDGEFELVPFRNDPSKNFKIGKDLPELVKAQLVACL